MLRQDVPLHPAGFGAASRGLCICQYVSGVQRMGRWKNKHSQGVGAGQGSCRNDEEGVLEMHVFEVLR